MHPQANDCGAVQEPGLRRLNRKEEDASVEEQKGSAHVAATMIQLQPGWLCARGGQYLSRCD